jgi:hypothetical protein
MWLEAETFSLPEAREHARKILEKGSVTYSSHARERLAKHNMTMLDVVNVLRGGATRPPEWENGSCRWRFWTPKMVVIVVFRSPEELRVVTAWREA